MHFTSKNELPTNVVIKVETKEQASLLVHALLDLELQLCGVPGPTPKMRSWFADEIRSQRRKLQEQAGLVQVPDNSVKEGNQ